jgi:2-polyprenyl-3-methyl-5-hydroxy-6-metoxy-1,4-benzoquinol methylase/glycosyltransferase involved in cell wall biosynthesis
MVMVMQLRRSQRSSQSISGPNKKSTLNNATKKKGLLIFPIYTDIGKADGIVLKNEGIHQAFLHHGIDTHALKFRLSGIFNGDEQVFRFSGNRYLRGWQLYAGAWNRLARYAVEHKYDFVWVRMPLVNPFIAKFVALIKKKLPSCKILLEYGAYPFENELQPRQLRYYKINKPYEQKAHQYADLMVTYSGQKEVDGIPNIPIDNGIDLSGIPVVRPDSNVSKRINFISVSSLKKWHAVERFVAGMPAYIKKQNGPEIHFHIVGQGPEHDKIKALVDSLALQPFVTFYGFRDGVGMDNAYDPCHVAIGTLGFHRIGIENSSSLKNREYFARGLPVILSTPDKDMPPDLPYVLYVPGGEEPVDISSVVDFTLRVYENPGTQDTIRHYADDHVSWNSKIRIVLEYLKLMDGKNVSVPEINKLPMTSVIKFINYTTGEPLSPTGKGLVDATGKVVYPLQNGAIRTVGEGNYTDNFGFQWNQFQTTQIDKINSTNQSLDRLFKVTGWDHEDLTGRNLLEVGSGAGRFSQVILDHTNATLYSVDYSDAVVANYQNNGHHGDRLKLFQASVYDMPFAPGQFDKVFCFGVLQHTPDVKKSVTALASMVRPGGELIVDFYPRHWYTKLHVKYLLRPFTKKMNHQKLLQVIDRNINWMIKASRFFNRIGLGPISSRVLPIVNINNTYFDQLSPELLREASILDTFDVYSPEHDQPQRLRDVKAWFEELGFENTYAGYMEHGGSVNLPIVKGIKK